METFFELVLSFLGAAIRYGLHNSINRNKKPFADFMEDTQFANWILGAFAVVFFIIILGGISMATRK
jgi:hypothetical protein